LLYRNWWTVFADYLKLHESPLVTYRLNNGLQYTLRPGTTDRGIINETWIRRDYSPDGFGINPTDTILDIGGHIGAFTVWASKQARQGRIITVEPTKSNFALLQQNVQDNRLTNVTLVKRAVAAQTGTAQLALASQNTGGHSFTVGLFESDVQSFETVETTTLASILADYGIERVNFLKIDCEGAEYEIFFTASHDILRRIDKIAMEFHELDAERNGLKMKEFLEKTGLFRVWINRSLLYALNVA
jgi:FkbM family methyltransferase